MKKLIAVILMFTFVLTAFAGCGATGVKAGSSSASSADVQSAPASKPMPETLPLTDNDEAGGADAYAGAGNHADSIYYGNPDFYRMNSNDHLTILPAFKTVQQTTEYCCGATSAYLSLSYLGVTDYSEWDLCLRGGVSVDADTPQALPGSADNFYEYGATVKKMSAMLSGIDGVEILESSYREDYAQDELLTEQDGVSGNNVGNLPGKFASTSLYASENTEDTEAWVENAADSYFVRWLTGHLNAGNCVMVEWSDWDGHWQVVIGYDTMGTPGVGDDVIIFADPYDTSDHWQDGYYYYPAERWFTMWKDRNVAEKPFQLQPYIVIGKTA